MEFFDILDIGEANLEILSPVSDERLLKLGEYLRLNSQCRVIDFGCGKGQLLALWGQHYGISGAGIDIRNGCYLKAARRIAELNLANRITIFQGEVADFDIEANSYDIACCIAASYIWGGFREALSNMRKALKPDGKLVIGEPYWISQHIDSARCEKAPFFSEPELLEISQDEGLDFEHVFRADREDIDIYEASHWLSYLNWIEANPGHSDIEKIIAHLHKCQKEYFEFDRDNLGWAIYVLRPIKYQVLSPGHKSAITSKALVS